MKKYYFIVLMFSASLSFAQNAPINFETGGYGAAWTWSVFENDSNPPLQILANPSPVGINTSATVAKFTALQTGNPWAGCESAHGTTNLGGFVLDTSNSLVKIMVWKPVISDVGIKFAAPTGWALPELKVANTLINQWEQLTFDFSAYTNPPATEGPYDQIIIFPDFNQRTQTNVIYFDNITFNAQAAAPTMPAVAAPTPPARNPADVISIFSSAYANVPGTDFNPNWGQSTIVTFPPVQGDTLLKYANLNYQGTQFGSALNVTGMDTLHLDMWTANATAVSIYCISTGPVETPYSLPITANQWVSYNIPLTAFSPVNLGDLIQFKFAGGTGTQTIFLDNIYFYKPGAVGIDDVTAEGDGQLVFPNPVALGEDIQLGKNVEQLDVYDVNGRLITSGNDAVVRTDGLDRGIYFLKIKTRDGRIQSQRLIVN